MSNFNKVILLGNLTRAPELKYTQSGTALCKFGLATNKVYTSNGEKKEKVTYVDVTAFGKTAETIHKYLRKGDPILFEGELEYSEWTNKDGDKRSKLGVICERFQFIGGKRDRATVPADAPSSDDSVPF